MIAVVSPEQLTELRRIFRGKGCTFFLYGSRVRGNFSPVFDLDVLAVGEKPLGPVFKEELNAALDASSLPFSVSVVDRWDLAEDFFIKITPTLVPLVEDGENVISHKSLGKTPRSAKHVAAEKLPQP